MKYDIKISDGPAAGKFLRRGLTLREAAFYTQLDKHELQWCIEEHGKANVLGSEGTELEITETSE